MKKVFNCEFGEVTVQSAMFDVDGTNLEEGFEIKSDEIGLIEVYGYQDIDAMTEEEVVKIIKRLL